MVKTAMIKYSLVSGYEFQSNNWFSSDRFL